MINDKNIVLKLSNSLFLDTDTKNLDSKKLPCLLLNGFYLSGHGMSLKQ